MTSDALQPTDNRYMSRKFWFIVALSMKSSAFAAANFMPISLWASTQLALAGIYVLGNVGAKAADKIGGGL
jgi:hypothetical protein